MAKSQEFNRTISIRFWGFKAKISSDLEDELLQEGVSRAGEMIQEGYSSGELNCLHVGNGKEEEIRGWWEVSETD